MLRLVLGCIAALQQPWQQCLAAVCLQRQGGPEEQQQTADNSMLHQGHVTTACGRLAGVAVSIQSMSAIAQNSWVAGLLCVPTLLSPATSCAVDTYSY
jgi:hypothetical protein